MSEATPTRDAIVDALRQLGGDATSSEIRAKTGLGKTTVNDNLKAMVGAGTVEKHGIPGRYRLVESVGADALPATGEWDYKHAGGDAAPLSTPDEDETPRDAPEPVAPSEPASSGIADVAEFLRANAPKLPEEDVSEEAAKEVVRGFCTEPVRRMKREDDAYPGEVGTVVTVACGAPIHKEGRSWVHDRTDDELSADAVARGDSFVAHKATTKSFRPPRPRSEPKADTKHINPNGVSYGRGELKGKVLDFLRKNPEESYKVAKIAAECAAFPGSTAFILKKLVVSGEVKQTNESPAEYQAA